MLFSLSSTPLSRSAQRSRLMGLAVVIAPLLGAIFYDRGGGITWLCPLRSLTGIPCPTCGMTRSFVAAVRGDWEASVHYHAFGLLLFLMLLIATLHLLLELGIQRQIQAVYGKWLRGRRWRVGFVASLLLYYALRLWNWAASGELLTAVQTAPIGQMLF